MLKEVKGNAVTELINGNIEMLIHQCNCFCNMGSGIAREIKEKLPRAYEVDLDTKKGDIDKLGTFSIAEIPEGRVVVNMYSQYKFGRGPVHTNYDMMRKALRSLASYISDRSFQLKNKPLKIGIPKLMGCARGGGDWSIVSKIIEEELVTSDLVEVVIININ